MLNKNLTVTNVIISQPAFDGIKFKEAIDLGLVCAAFDHQVNLIFIDHGITALFNEQNSPSLLDKNQTDILKGLEFYDIDNIYIETESLELSTISADQLLSSAQLKSSAEISQLHTSADHVVVF